MTKLINKVAYSILCRLTVLCIVHAKCSITMYVVLAQQHEHMQA